MPANVNSIVQILCVWFVLSRTIMALYTGGVALAEYLANSDHSKPLHFMLKFNRDFIITGKNKFSCAGKGHWGTYWKKLIKNVVNGGELLCSTFCLRAFFWIDNSIQAGLLQKLCTILKEMTFCGLFPHHWWLILFNSSSVLPRLLYLHTNT